MITVKLLHNCQDCGTESFPVQQSFDSVRQMHYGGLYQLAHLLFQRNTIQGWVKEDSGWYCPVCMRAREERDDNVSTTA